MMRTATLALVLFAASCTTVRVSSVDPRYKPIDRVCIERNAKVMVDDFIPIVEDGFRRHGIGTAVYDAPVPGDCKFVLTYTARRGWDMASFLKYAELRLQDGQVTIGSATYKHAGGFGLNKWASTESKMNPVIDQLLAAY